MNENDSEMKPSSLLILLPFLLVFIACAKREDPQEATDDVVKIKSYVAVDDSMLYGLACDGCNDSVLVFLPDSGGDPVCYSIIDARSEGRIFGRPRVGDKMAVLIDPENPKVVLLAVNMEQVKGTWYYEELPVLRLHASATNANELGKEEMVKRQQRRDSFINAAMVPREYSFTLKRDYTVKTEGGPPSTSSLDRRSPVEYPPIKRYMEWHLHNGKIIFSTNVKDSLDSMVLMNDTAEFVLLRRDTMALRFADHVQGFKLKRDSLAEERK